MSNQLFEKKESLDNTEIISNYNESKDYHSKRDNQKSFSEDIFKDFPFDNISINMHIKDKNVIE